jgi:transcription factor C subunit 6
MIASEQSSPRQSRGKPRKSYRVEEAYSFLDEDDNGSASSGAQTPAVQNGDDDEGDDFMPNAQEEEPEYEEEEDAVVEEDDESVEEQASSDEGSAEPPKRNARQPKVVDDAPASNVIRRYKDPRYKNTIDNIPSPVTFAKGGGVKVQSVHADTQLRTRGIPDFDKIGGHEPRLKNLFGPDDYHLRPVLASRDYWYPQETFPIRSYAKRQPDDAEVGSLRRSFFEVDGAREKEDEALRTWYTNTGKLAFAAAQKTRTLTADEAKEYMITPGSDTMNVLAGPINTPQVNTLAKGSYMNIAKPFPNSQERRGWLFNLGSWVKDAQWATKEDSSTQYLAVAIEQKPTSGNQPKSLEHPKAPAFNPTEPFPASIQVWSFQADDVGDLDASEEPRLELVICTEWGAPTQLRWCSVAATNTTEEPDDADSTHIGMLAGIWSDGRVRVLDISTPPRCDVQSPTYLQISCAAFEVSFPQTVPSCLHWLSGHTLAVATAAGTVGIWSLHRPGTLRAPDVENHNPRPWFYQQLADTYILTISSGWPSNPQFLSISTADGFARLFDLRSPNADTTASIRGRTLCLTQAWHEHTQSFVMPDEHYILRHTPIRRYYHNLYSMRLENTITRVATSPVHPGVLIGGVDGDIQASNPIMRITNYKTIPWQQKWFVHEWRGPMSRMLVQPTNGEDVAMTDSGETADNDDNIPGLQPGEPANSAKKVPQEVLEQPLVRITEGYKALQTGIAQTKASLNKKGNPEVGRSISIFEELTAVTALAWNPNLKTGTWSVAGMASGLLRVEDVGI